MVESHPNEDPLSMHQTCRACGPWFSVDQMGGSRNKGCIFPQKPSSYGGTPMTSETQIHRAECCSLAAFSSTGSFASPGARKEISLCWSWCCGVRRLPVTLCGKCAPGSPKSIQTVSQTKMSLESQKNKRMNAPPVQKCQECITIAIIMLSKSLSNIIIYPNTSLSHPLSIPSYDP